MNTSPVVRAALVGVALLGLSACTGGETAEQESTGASSSPATSAAAPSTSSQAPETSGSSDDEDASPQPSASGEAELSITVTAVSAEDEADELAEMKEQVDPQFPDVTDGAVDGQSTLVGEVQTGVSTFSADVPEGVTRATVTCRGTVDATVRLDGAEWGTLPCGPAMQVDLPEGVQGMTVELDGESRWAYAFHRDENLLEPEPPANWEQVEREVQAMAQGLEPGATGDGQAAREMVGSVSGASTYFEGAPKGADGVVVTCGGEGTGRVVVGPEGAPVTFHCAAIVDMPLPSSGSTITIEVEDNTFWHLAYYEEKPAAK